MEFNKLLTKILPPLVEWEIQQIKQSGETFELDKETFNPKVEFTCLYGQKFGGSETIDSLTFKTENLIPPLFSIFDSEPYAINESFQKNATALEIWCFFLWKQNKKDQVIRALDPIVTWKQNDFVFENSYSIEL